MQNENKIENVVKVETEQVVEVKKESKFKSAIRKVGKFVSRNKKKIIAGAVIVGGAAVGALAMRRGVEDYESDCDCDVCDGDCSNCDIEVFDYEVTDSEVEE